MVEVEVILFLVKLISKEKSPYTNAPKRKNPNGINEEMSNKTENAKMLEVKYMDFFQIGRAHV